MSLWTDEDETEYELMTNRKLETQRNEIINRQNEHLNSIIATLESCPDSLTMNIEYTYDEPHLVHHGIKIKTRGRLLKRTTTIMEIF